MKISNVSAALAALPLTLALSASCFAKDEITIAQLMANPKVYAGDKITVKCTISSVDLGSAYCNEGGRSVSLSARTMDKVSRAFALAHCAKPNESDNDARCKDVLVTATLKDPKIPGWLDNAKIGFKGLSSSKSKRK